MKVIITESTAQLFLTAILIDYVSSLIINNTKM